MTDYNFDLIISETDLKSDFTEKTFTWDGVEHRCVPRQFCVGDSTVFTEVTNGAIHDILIKNTGVIQPVFITIDRRKYSVEEFINSKDAAALFSIISKTGFDLYLWKDDETTDIEYEFSEGMDIGRLLKKALENDINIRIINR